MRKSHSNTFKFKVALAAHKGEQTISELCQTYEVAASLIHKWKKQLLEHGVNMFEAPKSKKSKQTDEKQVDKLYQTIGQLTVERDFLKKSWERLEGESD